MATNVNKRRPTLNIMNSTAPAPVVPVIVPITDASGQPVPGTDKSIVDAIRAFYTKYVKYGENDQEQHFTQFADVAIWDIYAKLLAQYPTNDPPTLFGSVMARIVNAENAAAQDAAIDPNVDERIRDAATLLGANIDLMEVLERSIDASTVLKMTLSEITALLLQTYATVIDNGVVTTWSPGTAEKFSCSDIDGWPTPGHNEGDKNDDGTPIIKQNTGWDSYWFTPSGTNKRAKASFYKNLVVNLPFGRSIQNTIDEMVKASVTPQTGKYAADGPDYHSVEEAAGAVRNLSDNLGTCASWLRDAVRLIRQMQAMNDMKHMKCCMITNVHTVTGEDGVTQEARLTTGPNKIKVMERHASGGSWPMTIGAFMRYDCAKAEANGGTKAALDKTSKAERAPTPGGQQNNVAEKWTLINFTANMVRFGDFIGNMDNAAAIQRFFNDPDPTKSDAALKSLGDAYTSIQAMFLSHPDYVERVEKLLGFSKGTIDPAALKLNVG